MLLDKEPRRSFISKKGIVPNVILALALLPIASACVGQQSNITKDPTPSPTLSCLQEVDILPDTITFFGQFLIINSLPSGSVEIYDRKTLTKYDLPQDKVEKHFPLSDNFDAEVVFKKENHILVRKGCGKTNPSFK